MPMISTLSPKTKTASTTLSLSPSTSLLMAELTTDSESVSYDKNSNFSTVPSTKLRNGRIKKGSYKRRERKRTIAKLRRMLSHNKNIIKCSELELINHIMDYIIALQEMLQNDENIADENRHHHRRNHHNHHNSSNIEIANLNRALSRFHLCGTNQRLPLRPAKQICI